MIEDYALVEDSEDLIRDISSNAIVNSNRGALALAKAKQKAAAFKLQEQQNLINDVELLKQDIGDIKNMLSQLLGRK